MAGRSVLVVNAGSATLKFQVVAPDDGEVLARGTVDRVTGRGYDAALAAMQEQVADAGLSPDGLLAVGHRVVHGGPRFTEPTLVDDEVLAEIEDLARLAPLHNPPAASGIRAARNAWPDLPQVAVFDTAFFSDLPAAAATYALDRELAEREGLRRYGFHGTSHAYVSAAAAEFLGRDPATMRQIVLHLGNGASASAVRGGRPVDTSMGFTPLEGLVMGTRPGDVDPGVLVHLLARGALSVDDLATLLNRKSGLLGLAGMFDFRDLQSAVDRGDHRARLAYDVYCHRLRKYVGAYLAVLGGVDAIVFTAGVGENGPQVRADALAGLEELGIVLDPGRNEADKTGPRLISPDDAQVAVLVVPTNEELEIARQATALLAESR